MEKVSLSKCYGEIQLILGPMFAGKTTELMRRLRRYTAANKSCTMIKHKRDHRYSDGKVSTHDSTEYPAARCNEEDLERLTDDKAFLDSYDIIGLDEGHFFANITCCAESLANKGKIVIISALSASFNRTPFRHISSLSCVSDSVIYLFAVCNSCFQEKGAFTKRRAGTDYKDPQELVGGAEQYSTFCRTCWFNFKNI